MSLFSVTVLLSTGASQDKMQGDLEPFFTRGMQLLIPLFRVSVC